MKWLVLAKMLTTVEYMLVRKHLTATLDYTKEDTKVCLTRLNPILLLCRVILSGTLEHAG